MNENERQIYEKALTKCTDTLCRYLDVKYCFPLFKSKFILNGEDIEIIESEKVSSRRAMVFLDILRTKDVKLAFETLFEYVSKRAYQAHVAQDMRKALKESRNEFVIEEPQPTTPIEEHSLYASDASTHIAVQPCDDDVDTQLWWPDISNPNVRLESASDDLRLETATTLSTVETTSLFGSSSSISVISSVSNINSRLQTLRLPNDETQNLIRNASLSQSSVSIISTPQSNISERTIPSTERFLKPPNRLKN